MCRRLRIVYIAVDSNAVLVECKHLHIREKLLCPLSAEAARTNLCPVEEGRLQASAAFLLPVERHMSILHSRVAILNFSSGALDDYKRGFYDISTRLQDFPWFSIMSTAVEQASRIRQSL